MLENKGITDITTLGLYKARNHFINEVVRKVDNTMTDAEHLKSIRNALHLTQAEMANKLGYANQESISRIEQGHTGMAPQTRAHLKTIEHALLPESTQRT